MNDQITTFIEDMNNLGVLTHHEIEEVNINKLLFYLFIIKEFL
jgi:hypothetical protein